MTHYSNTSVAEKGFLVSLKQLAKQIMAFYRGEPNDLTIVNGQIKMQRNVLTNLIWSCKYPVKTCNHNNVACMLCPDSKETIIQCRQQCYDVFNRLTSSKLLLLNPNIKTDTHVTPSTMYNVIFDYILGRVFLRSWDSTETLQKWIKIYKEIHAKLRLTWNAKTTKKYTESLIQPKLKSCV